MQKYLVAAALAAALGMGGAASAADVYSGGLKDGPVYVANTWTGFYLGGHFGVAWGEDKVKDLDSFDQFAGETTRNNTRASGVYGLQTGYNWQQGNIVFGAEVDLGQMDLNHVRPDLGGDSVSLSSGLYGDVTARLGYAFGPALAYAKGGFAFFDGEAAVFGQGRTGATDTFTGWTIGGGLEYALNPAWSIKAEYQHFDFGKENSTDTDVTSANAICSTCRFSHELTVDSVKGGLNYHVGRGFEPLK